MQQDERNGWSRRRLLQVGAGATLAAGAALTTGMDAHAMTSAAPGAGAMDPGMANEADSNGPKSDGSMADVPYAKREPRIGMIGVGGRGTSLLGNLLAADGQVVAVCDLVPEKAQHAAELITKAGQKAPELFTDGDHAYERMLGRGDVDFVIVATPWVWHAPMAIAAMKHGKDVAVEVPAVRTLEECWAIVRASEETKKHCTMLENCCYGYNETLVLRMTHAGLLGELLYGEGAYLHDLREELFSDKGEGLWRRKEHTLRDGNLYPTHGLGPVANYMGIERGDRFGYLVSMSSPERGLDAYRKAHLQPSDPRMAEKYVTGDLNTSLIKTAKGLTVTVKHGVTTPHPYDRINLIAGTKGLFEDYPARLYIDGQNEDESWGDLKGYKQYDYPLWTKEGELAKKVGGHGGMDFIMLYRLLQCLREGLPPDMDVYDAASWSAVAPLSVTSVAKGSMPQEFPDFTGGRWKQRKPSAIATLT